MLKSTRAYMDFRLRAGSPASSLCFVRWFSAPQRTAVGFQGFKGWIGLCLVLCLCASCGIQTATTATAAVVTATPRETERPTPLPSRTPVSWEQVQQLIQSDLAGQLDALVLIAETDGGVVHVRFQILQEGATARTIRSARADTAVILYHIAKSRQEFAGVEISGWSEITVDINGTLRNTELLALRYDRETIEAIQWETLRERYIWLIADYAGIHQALQE